MHVETILITMIQPYSPNGQYYNTKKKEVIRSWKKTVGRPRLRWEDDIRRDSSLLLNVRQLMRLTGNKDIWR